MSHLAIRAAGLGKRYHLGQPVNRYRTLRDVLAQGARAALRFGRASSAAEEFWALRDVSFEVAAGEVLGVIGSNGAGKSTLLKILSRITAPTTGHAEVHGRVGSLLEVGTGFHPELTGRENIFLNGAVLGMRRTEIARKFDEIVAFAEIERFIDTAVKFYSSGMYMRLAFAVAAHLEPEILFVDEVLAVGDAAFQKKCLGKMGDVARGGRTVLFVSHNLSAVRALCTSALWLRQGEVADRGRTDHVLAQYLRTVTSGIQERRWDDPATAPGNDVVRLRRASIRPTVEGEDMLTTSTPFVIEFEYWNLLPEATLSLGFELYNREEVLVCSVGRVPEEVFGGRPMPVGLYRDAWEVPGNLLNDGVHRIDLRVARDNELAFRFDELLAFDVHDAPDLRGSWYGEWPGAIRPAFPCRTELLREERPSGV